MITLEQYMTSNGMTVEPSVVRPVVRTPRGFKADTRCPKCRLVHLLTDDDKRVILPYQRSVCTGAVTCSDCGGAADGIRVYCERCRDKGYVLRFEKQWFDYACSACVYELRRRKW